MREPRVATCFKSLLFDPRGKGIMLSRGRDVLGQGADVGLRFISRQPCIIRCYLGTMLNSFTTVLHEPALPYSHTLRKEVPDYGYIASWQIDEVFIGVA